MRSIFVIEEILCTQRRAEVYLKCIVTFAKIYAWERIPYGNGIRSGRTGTLLRNRSRIKGLPTGKYRKNLKGQRKETIATEVHDEKKDDNGPDADDSAVYRHFDHRLCGAAEQTPADKE